MAKPKLEMIRFQFVESNPTAYQKRDGFSDEGVAPQKNLLFLQVEIPKGRGWMEGSLSNIGCWKDGTDRAGLIKILAFAHHILQQETWNKMTFM